MERIYVRGTSGSGKSTLAREISTKLCLPHTELDALFHLPGWQQRDNEEFKAMIGEVSAHEGWVIDGNYSAATDCLLERCTTLVWLDYSFTVVLARMLRRTAHRVITRESVCNGNVETFRKSFLSRDSVIWWMITTYQRNRKRCDEFFADARLLSVEKHRFRSPAEAELWLKSKETQLP